MRWYASLRRPGEIAFVRRRGRFAGTPSVGVHAAPALAATSLVVVSVSKAVGNAVVRNLVKRRIKGALDRAAAPQPALRLVVVARPPAASLAYGTLEGDVRSALARVANP